MTRLTSERIIYAIDPGTEQSALVVVAPHGPILKQLILPNQELRNYLRHCIASGSDLLAVEMIQSFGMPVGASTFETVLWLGRFIEAWGGDFQKIYRTTIKGHLCNSARAKDAHVRQALLDRYPATGGGKTPQVGTKKQPGPLFGFKSHLWSALAVAVTVREQASA